jgi:hypothetical protein
MTHTNHHYFQSLHHLSWTNCLNYSFTQYDFFRIHQSFQDLKVINTVTVNEIKITYCVKSCQMHLNKSKAKCHDCTTNYKHVKRNSSQSTSANSLHVQLQKEITRLFWVSRSVCIHVEQKHQVIHAEEIQFEQRRKEYVQFIRISHK